MYGWTEFDMVRIENERKEAKLHRDAMMPKLEPHHPIRAAMARTLMTLAQHISAEHARANQSPTLAIGTSER